MGRKKDQYKAHSGLFTSERNPRKRPRSETEQDEATPTVRGVTHWFFGFFWFFRFLPKCKYFRLKNKHN